ncbi:MAG: glycoside hydrolase family 57 protein [Candidatus Peregrinibacteria bacterium]|nr:glycoside hydrolase family 57 protein [Candidatus Peregrinibacteria bacterium]
MQPLISLYFQVHQPYRLRDLRITDIGKAGTKYFDAELNRTLFRKVAEKCYLPANKLMLSLLQKYSHFSVAYSLSGSFIDQCRDYGEDVLQSFRALAATGKVEFLAETYYHSLSSLKSLPEFCEQVTLHRDTIRDLFGVDPTTFRNTELIYSNELAQVVRLLGFNGILAEGVDALLAGRSPNDPFAPPQFRLPPEKEAMIEAACGEREQAEEIAVLLKNYRLSDDVAFRFSDRTWVGFPLTADRFTDWITEAGGHSINLFMDYETFGEHQWKDTGVFEFLEALPRLWEERGLNAATPSQVIAAWGKRDHGVFDAHAPISWADCERDLSAWLGNRIQEASVAALYALEHDVKERGDAQLLQDWRRLQTSDHFYYMSTKYWSDGDVHKYFSPYDSPYEAYRRFSHALHDLRCRLATDETTPSVDTVSGPSLT